MDAKNSVVTSMTIRDGVIESVGAKSKPAPCERTIDIGGRTAIPGLIDNHNHIVALGLRPGHDTRLESATTIAEMQALITARAKDVPAGEFITAMGGWNAVQLVEKRLPTLKELDAAAPDHPVILYQAFTGPAAVNSRAKAFFEMKGVAVSAEGAIAANAPSLAALNALRAAQTFADQKRGTLDAMAYAARVGITTSADMGVFPIPGKPDIQDSLAMDTLASGDPFHIYDAFQALHREGKMTMRLRVFFLSMDKDMGIPLLRQRVLNTLLESGDDMLRPAGVGEFATAWPLFGTVTPPPNYQTALEFIANAGWPYQQHSLTLAEDQLVASTFEAVNAKTPIAGLRWSIAHSPRIDQATLNRLKAVGAGIAVHPFEYLGAAGGGPPLRMILDSGIHVGAGSDSAQISTLNPWLIISYMVTGKTAAGVLVNAGQQVTREEALRLYTRENGWFWGEENKLGSLEQGKLGDMVVLGADYFDAKKVPDEEIRKTRPVMTIVDGKVVYDGLK